MTTIAPNVTAATIAPRRDPTAVIPTMVDPTNRFYRYPLARRLLPLALRAGLTANHVTGLHTLCGIVAALAVLGSSPPALLVAGVLWEIHLVLDCLDGEVARARASASQHGRTLDIMGDTVSYIALAAAMAIHVRRGDPTLPAATIAVVLIVSGALAAWAHDFYLRKLTAALVDGTDPVYEQLRAKRRAIERRGGFVAWFGYVFEWIQVFGLQPATFHDFRRRIRADEPAPPGTTPEVRYIVAHADTRAGRRARRAISLMSNDNNVTLVGLGLVTGHVLAGELAAIAWGVVTLVGGTVACQAFLRGAARSRP